MRNENMDHTGDLKWRPNRIWLPAQRKKKGNITSRRSEDVRVPAHMLLLETLLSFLRPTASAPVLLVSVSRYKRENMS